MREYLMAGALALMAGGAQAAIVEYSFTSGEVPLSGGVALDGIAFSIAIDTSKTIRTFYIDEGPYDAQPYTVDFASDGILLEGGIRPGGAQFIVNRYNDYTSGTEFFGSGVFQGIYLDGDIVFNPDNLAENTNAQLTIFTTTNGRVDERLLSFEFRRDGYVYSLENSFLLVGDLATGETVYQRANLELLTPIPVPLPANGALLLLALTSLPVLRRRTA